MSQEQKTQYSRFQKLYIRLNLTQQTGVNINGLKNEI